MKKDTSWGNVASWYDELLSEDDTYQSKVILPNLTRILDIQKGDKILDLACGQGFFSRAFASAGADVTGVDISKELIAKAQERNTKKTDTGPLNKSKGNVETPALSDHTKLHYEVSPSHDLSMIESGTVNKIVIVLALQNIEKIKETLDECRRVLVKGGEFCIVLNHPAFRIPKRSSWGYDEKLQVQYRRIDGYLSDSKEEIIMNPGQVKEGGKPEKTVSFHRPLQSYFKFLQKSGFTVSRLEEWNSHRKSEPGKRSKAEDVARKEIPLFLALVANAL